MSSCGQRTASATPSGAAPLHEDRALRPLDQVRSIKVKLGIVIVGAVVIGMLVFQLTRHAGALGWLAAIGSALVMVMVLARGMTSPLREMADAAEAISAGDYRRRVTATSQDEVGSLARAFNAMAEQVERTDTVRRDLVANVSHELRTPLAALQAGLENLVDGVGQPDPATLQLLLEQAERLGRLCQQLLDLSRLEAGTVPLAREVFPLGLVLDDVARAAALHAPASTVITSCAPDLAVAGDPERVYQVVSNLVDNALRHGPVGQPVEVTATREGGTVILAVSDHGAGIPPEEAALVFDRFYRLDAARSERDGGAGLGLAIVKWIVDLHGGTIRAERGEDGSGCRMVVTLPAALT